MNAAATSARVDLDAYFERIGWRGEARPDHVTLAGLLAAHMSRIPFENLDVLLGRGVCLDLAALSAKLVRDRRGGYCFEHATLFAAVLEQIGFSVVRQSARVLLYLPRHLAPRTHMFLVVDLPEGRFVADPGFGGLAARVPVPLSPGKQVRSPGMLHWMARDADAWVLRAEVDGAARDCWVATSEAEYPIDFELANHYTATHPASAFRNRLMLRAFSGAAEVRVMNRDVTIVRGTASQASVLADRAALRALLRDHFGFDLPEVETMEVPEWR